MRRRAPAIVERAKTQASTQRSGFRKTARRGAAVYCLRMSPSKIGFIFPGLALNFDADCRLAILIDQRAAP